MDLSLDIQYRVLERLDLPDLLTLSEINDYSILAEDVFRRKYSKKVMEIINPLNDTTEEPITEFDSKFYVNHLEIALRILKKFGYLLEKIRFDASIDVGSSINEISSYINLYCSDTLKKLHVVVTSNDNSSFFNGMLKPFKAVEEVSLFGTLGKMNSSTLDFIEMFPVMRTIIMSSVYFEDTSFIDRKFAQLEHVSIIPAHFFVKYNNSVEEKSADVEKMFKKNPQIRSLHLTYCSVQNLKMANELLPNLEHLEIVFFNSAQLNEEPLFFGNMKIFTLFTQQMPRNVSFGHLTELNTNSEPDLDWIKLVEKNPHLEKLTVNRGYVSREQLNRLATLVLNMREVILRLDRDMEDVPIVNFVRNIQKIKKITFKRDNHGRIPVTNTFNTLAITLQIKFGDIWNIMEYPDDLILVAQNY